MQRLMRLASTEAAACSALRLSDRVSRPPHRALTMDVYHQKRGRIQIIFGPMFSGKTTELIRIVKRFSIAKRKCLLIKYSKDDRYSVHGVSTHDKYGASPPRVLGDRPQAGVNSQGVHEAGRAARDG